MGDCACTNGRPCLYHLLSVLAQDVTSAFARDDARIERELERAS